MNHWIMTSFHTGSRIKFKIKLRKGMAANNVSLSNMPVIKIVRRRLKRAKTIGPLQKALDRPVEDADNARYASLYCRSFTDMTFGSTPTSINSAPGAAISRAANHTFFFTYFSFSIAKGAGGAIR